MTPGGTVSNNSIKTPPPGVFLLLFDTGRCLYWVIWHRAVSLWGYLTPGRCLFEAIWHRPTGHPTKPHKRCLEGVWCISDGCLVVVEGVLKGVYLLMMMPRIWSCKCLKGYWRMSKSVWKGVLKVSDVFLAGVGWVLKVSWREFIWCLGVFNIIL